MGSVKIFGYSTGYFIVAKLKYLPWLDFSVVTLYSSPVTL